MLMTEGNIFDNLLRWNAKIKLSVVIENKIIHFLYNWVIVLIFKLNKILFLETHSCRSFAGTCQCFNISKKQLRTHILSGKCTVQEKKSSLWSMEKKPEPQDSVGRLFWVFKQNQTSLSWISQNTFFQSQ